MTRASWLSYQSVVTDQSKLLPAGASYFVSDQTRASYWPELELSYLLSDQLVTELFTKWPEQVTSRASYFVIY